MQIHIFKNVIKKRKLAAKLFHSHERNFLFLSGTLEFLEFEIYLYFSTHYVMQNYFFGGKKTNWKSRKKRPDVIVAWSFLIFHIWSFNYVNCIYNGSILSLHININFKLPTAHSQWNKFFLSFVTTLDALQLLSIRCIALRVLIQTSIAIFLLSLITIIATKP